MKFVSGMFAFLSMTLAVHATESTPRRLVTVDQIRPFVEKAFQDLSGLPEEVDLRGVKEEETLEWQIDNGIVTPQIFSVGDQWIVKVAPTKERGLGEIKGSRRAQAQLEHSEFKDSFLFIAAHDEIRIPDGADAAEERSLTLELMKKGAKPFMRVWNEFREILDRESERQQNYREAYEKIKEKIHKKFFQVGGVVAELHECNVRHGDLHFGNILSDEFNVFVIDWDRCVTDPSSIMNCYWDDVNDFRRVIWKNFDTSLDEYYRSGFSCSRCKRLTRISKMKTSVARVRNIYSLCSTATLSFIEGYLNGRSSPVCEHSVIEKFYRLGDNIKAHHEAWKESKIIPGWMVDEFTQQVKNDTLRLYDLLKDKINISDNPYYEDIDDRKYFTNLYQNREKFVQVVEGAPKEWIDNIKEFIEQFRKTV